MGQDTNTEIGKKDLLHKNVVSNIALVDMYSKCHALEQAQQMFKQLLGRNIISWNALIAQYT